MKSFLFFSAVMTVALNANIGMAQDTDNASQFSVLKTDKNLVQKLLEKRFESRFVPGEVIVKMKSAVSASAEASANAMTQLGLQPKIKQTSGGEVVYKLATGVTANRSAADIKQLTLDAVKELSQRPDVEYAQPNYIFQIAATPNDPGYPLQWHYFDHGSESGKAAGGINLPQVWETNKGDASVVVAVIDTGILKNHADIAGSPNLLPGYDMISDAFTANDGDGRDADASDSGDAIAANECYPGSPEIPDSWHGTHVAGTVGVGRTNNNSGVAGVNWNVKVLPLRVLGKCGGTMVDINDAIRWAAGIHVDGVPDNSNPAKVINMSLGGSMPCSNSPATQNAINEVVARGVTVVVAAGNEAQDVANVVPGGCDNVIAVAASDRSGNLVTRYSNYGAKVDILAPGGDVITDSDNDGNPDGVLSMVQGGYAFYNGTSMAAPHVAGVAALMLANNSALSPAEVEQGIKIGALPRSSDQCSKPCGAGLLDAKVAIATSLPDQYSLTVSPGSVSLEEGDKTNISALLKQNNTPAANKTVVLSSSNPAVATVSPQNATTGTNGETAAQIMALKPGTAAITLTHETARESISVEVKAKESRGAFSIWMILALSLMVVLVKLRRRVIKSSL